MDTIAVLKKCELFYGMTSEEINKIFHCLGGTAKIRHFIKGETIMPEGAEVVEPGIILSGAIEASKVTYDGRECIIAHMPAGGMFGEILNAAGIAVSPITLKTTEDSKILFIRYEELIHPCKEMCPCHLRLTENLLKIVSLKYWGVQHRIDCISASNLREKILMYLADAKIHFGNPDGTICVPMNREKLASYLNADRSALCRELSNMKKDGLIDYDKNAFRLL